MKREKCMVCDKYLPSHAFAESENGQLKRCWSCQVKMKRLQYERSVGLRPHPAKDKCMYKSFAHQLIENVEHPIPDFSGYLTVTCANCGKYFWPNLQDTKNRVFAINSDKYSGENRLYCSTRCKNSCSIFNQKAHTKGTKISRTRADQSALREIVLERDKDTCQICGSTKDLRCHHITGIMHNPIESADTDNCITLCKHCHRMVHKLPGCAPIDLRC